MSQNYLILNKLNQQKQTIQSKTNESQNGVNQHESEDSVRRRQESNFANKYQEFYESQSSAKNNMQRNPYQRQQTPAPAFNNTGINMVNTYAGMQYFNTLNNMSAYSSQYANQLYSNPNSFQQHNYHQHYNNNINNNINNNNNKS